MSVCSKLLRKTIGNLQKLFPIPPGRKTHVFKVRREMIRNDFCKPKKCFSRKNGIKSKLFKINNKSNKVPRRAESPQLLMYGAKKNRIDRTNRTNVFRINKNLVKLKSFFAAHGIKNKLLNNFVFVF